MDMLHVASESEITRSTGQTRATSTLRSTQRAPKSCSNCLRRKVKCDKSIPCTQCTRRGVHDSCTRETVLIRGKATVAQDTTSPSYQDLLKENEQLKTILKQKSAGEASCSFEPTQENEYTAIAYDMDAFELLLFEPKADPGMRSVKGSWPNILLPNRNCSMALVEIDRNWNSWVHAALDPARFEIEHNDFWQALQSGKSIDDIDPSWLAVYFSVICAALLIISDEDAKCIDLPSNNHHFLVRTWYASALYCLEKSEFMRHDHIHSVQAIAIMAICYNNFGDSTLFSTHWACAIRIAQRLGMNETRETPIMGLSAEWCRRLWWTLMICEWLAVPNHFPSISLGDCNVPLPSVEPHEAVKLVPEINSVTAPIQYHIVMAQIASTYYRFRAALRARANSLVELVREADERLADVINNLPHHLQPELSQTPDGAIGDILHPWIPWQRWNLGLVLLYYRLHINRTLQNQWLVSPDTLRGPKSVCLSCAKAIIHNTKLATQPLNKRRQWALAVHVVAAAVCLALQSKSRDSRHDDTWRDDINECILYLEQIKSWNSLAQRGSDIMRGLLNDDVASLYQEFGPGYSDEVQINGV